IHTHLYYSHFNDIILSIIDMDANVITRENSSFDEKLLSIFHNRVQYGAGIGPNLKRLLREPPRCSQQMYRGLILTLYSRLINTLGSSLRSRSLLLLPSSSAPDLPKLKKKSLSNLL
ncbi:hypothetical protein ACJRO7_007303, partial [Eucalyptus globulus]